MSFKFRDRVATIGRFRFRSQQITNRLLYETSRPKPILSYRPIWLLFYLTDACNLWCRMCPHHTVHNASNFAYLKNSTYSMPLSTIEEIIARFPEAMVASLAGVGEPTVHPQFLQILDRLTTANMITDLTTNGYKLRGRILDALTENRYVREISISLNGASADEHTSITECHGFEDVLENVRALVERRKRTGYPSRIAVSQVCTNDNVRLWPEYVRLAASLEVDRLYMHNVIDMDIQADGLKTLHASEGLAKAIGALPPRVGGTTIIRPVLIGKLTGPPKCQWFFRNLAFDAAGNLGSCGRVMNPQPEYGSIWAEEDLWNNSYMQELRATFLDKSAQSLREVCTKCVENFQT
jgi:radical SAM protein with 4Fe4S-binding SPASM domain